MKIFILASCADMLINFREELILSMIDHNYEVIVGIPKVEESHLVAFKRLKVRHLIVNLHRTGLNLLEDYKTFRQLVKIFKNERPDVLLSYTIKPVIYGSLAAKKAGVTAIYSMITGLGYAFIGTGFKRRLIQIGVKFLYKRAIASNRKVFFQNPDDLNLFKSLKIIKTDRGVLINGSGVNLKNFSVAPLTKKKSFLLIARLLRDKGIYEYVAAAKEVKKIFPKAEFHLVGFFDTNPSSIDKTDLSNWQKEGLIRFWGKQNDVRPAMREAAVYVLPSYREGTPRTVLEAMAMGRPIITTDAPGCRETVIDGVNGYLVPLRNTKALVDKMLKLIQSPVLLHEMGKKSRQIAEQKYDVHKVNYIILKNMDLS